MYNDVREHGRVKKSPNDNRDSTLSASYIASLHRMFSMAMDRAVKERLIIYNPCDDVILPKVEKKEMKILKPEDMTAYLKEANKREVLPMFFLELCTGLRKGELVALLWEDLNMERKTIRVNKQAIGVKGGGVKVTRPKTETSIRTVSIPQEAIDLLIQEHQKHPDNPYMFPSPVTGGMYYPDAITRLHTKILDSAGIEHIRFHDMRHTFATTALQNGVDIRTVSGMLGHFDAGFTLRTYTHVTNSVQEQAAYTMGSVMSQHI
jgi:integrase